MGGWAEDVFIVSDGRKKHGVRECRNAQIHGEGPVCRTSEHGEYIYLMVGEDSAGESADSEWMTGYDV